MTCRRSGCAKASALLGALALAAFMTVGCSDDNGGKADRGVGGDGQVASEGGTKADSSGGPQACMPTFGANEACGGGLVGSWKYVSICSEKSLLAPLLTSCPTATVSNEVLTVSGTLTMAAVSFTRAATGTASADVTVPTPCASIVGGCPGVVTTIKSVVPGSSASCGAASSGCSCKVTLPVSTNDTGTYIASFTTGTVTINPTGGGTIKYYYCVKNNVLRYKGFPTNTRDNVLSYVLTH